MSMELHDLYHLAEIENIKVTNFPMRENISVSVPSGHIGMDYRKIETVRDETVYLAHELGHIQTGSFYNNCSKFDVKSRAEYRADKWAIHHLLSKHKLKKAFAQSLTEVWQLAEHFNLPESFIKKALKFYNYI